MPINGISIAYIKMIRKAVIKDAESIHQLIEAYAQKGEMLRRPTEEVYRRLREYFVNEDGDDITGVSALHIFGKDLAEIRSLAVREDSKGRGIGTALVNACMKEAQSLGIKKVFALTYSPGFFLRLGFEEIDKLNLPQKIWRDCITCKKFPECDEIAVIKEL